MDSTLRKLARAAGDDPVERGRYARELLRAGDVRKALDALLELWRADRDPVVGELIDEASAGLPVPTPGGDLQRWWLETAREHDPTALPGLLAVLREGPLHQVEQRLAALTTWPDDPRTAMALARFVDATPFRSTSSKALWRSVFELLERLRDPRTLPILEGTHARPSAVAGATFRAWLTQRLGQSIQALPRQPLPAPRGPTAAPTATPKDDPLAAVYADPSSDEARLRCAEALEARGDVRGEFIRLQLRGDDLDRKQRARLKVLSKQLGAWAGPLGEIMIKARSSFDRGFLSTLFTRNVAPREWADLEGRPEWSTVEVLQTTTNDPVGLGRALRQEVTRSLRTVIVPDRASVLGLAPNEQLTALQCGAGIGVGRDKEGQLHGTLDRELLETLERFPALRRLSLRGVLQVPPRAVFEGYRFLPFKVFPLGPEDAAPLLRTKVFKRLEWFGLSELVDVRPWLEALESSPRLTTFEVQDQAACGDRCFLDPVSSTWLQPLGWTCTFSRDARGRFSRARLVRHDASGRQPLLSPSTLFDPLRKVLTELTVVGTSVGSFRKRFPFATAEAAP